MTTEEKNEILKMSREGRNQRDIAIALNIPKTTIQNFLMSNEGIYGYGHCEVCGKEFSYTNRTMHKKFCSDRCNRNNYVHNHPQKKTYKRTCECCGKEFLTYPFKKSQRFCSKECRYRFIGEHGYKK